uniref:Peptidase S1 domain-containing protein n=1 Tax=Cacopsylla melanoneura TaxID=428564 RepID=A0A8D9EP68_9HEMI
MYSRLYTFIIFQAFLPWLNLLNTNPIKTNYNFSGTGPCNGDSGAGLVILDPNTNIWYLRALVSLAMVDNNTQRCDLNRSVVLTNISKFQAWIQQTLTND